METKFKDLFLPKRMPGIHLTQTQTGINLLHHLRQVSTLHLPLLDLPKLRPIVHNLVKILNSCLRLHRLLLLSHNNSSIIEALHTL